LGFHFGRDEGGFGVNHGNGGLFASFGIDLDEFSEFRGGVGAQVFIVVFGEGAKGGFEGEAFGARRGGELEDSSVWVDLQPSVESGSILGREVRETIIFSYFHAGVWH